jgi:hypothetical protein
MRLSLVCNNRKVQRYDCTKRNSYNFVPERNMLG